MSRAFRFADRYGPLKIIHVHEPSVGLRAIAVIDNVAIGPAIGGLRIAEDVSLDECFRLARSMTLKNAAAGLPHGGGKSVLFGSPLMPAAEKEAKIRAFACALADTHEYIIGPDMGTNETCMAWVRDEIGRCVGLPREIGGIPLDEIGATAWGLTHAIEVALEYCDFGLDGARVVTQGFGAVGWNTARFLRDRGAIVVGACDSGGAIHNANGLDIEALHELNLARKSVGSFPDGQRHDRDAVIDMDCDIFVPAARPDVINDKTVDRLKARLVAPGANIACTDSAEQTLHERGVICLPDFIANAGGVICAAVEYAGGTETVAMQTIEDKLRRNTREVLAEAQSRGVRPREAAKAMALRHLEVAMGLRRWSLF